MLKACVRPRTVIAEDFVLIQETIRNVIEPYCDVVAAVEDGEAAWYAVDTLAAELLLLDISLRGMNGFAVAEKLNQAHSPVKVIFVTAHGDRGYIERAFELGAKGYVLKGAMRSDLPSAITEVASGRLYRSPLIA